MSRKSLVVIVEGPDRCGKSSFIEAFRDLSITPNIITLHSTKPPFMFNTTGISSHVRKSAMQKDWSSKYNKMLLDSIHLLSKTVDIIILDRSYLGEYIYGNLYRAARYSNDDFTQFELDNLNTSLCEYVLVTFVDSPEALIEREDGKSHSDALAFKRVEVQRFKELHETSIIPNKHLIDWTSEKFTGILLNELVGKILMKHNQNG